VLLLKMLYITFWNVLYTRTREEHFLVIATIFCFAVINSFVYFVRRGLHISWYSLLSNPIVYVQ